MSAPCPALHVLTYLIFETNLRATVKNSIFLVFNSYYVKTGAFQVVLVVKNLRANEGDIRDRVSIPGSGRSSGGGHGNPLQDSCLENPMDRGAWWAIVHRITQSQTQLKRISLHT